MQLFPSLLRSLLHALLACLLSRHCLHNETYVMVSAYYIVRHQTSWFHSLHHICHTVQYSTVYPETPETKRGIPSKTVPSRSLDRRIFLRPPQTFLSFFEKALVFAILDFARFLRAEKDRETKRDQESTSCCCCSCLAPTDDKAFHSHHHCRLRYLIHLPFCCPERPTGAFFPHSHIHTEK